MATRHDAGLCTPGEPGCTHRDLAGLQLFSNAIKFTPAGGTIHLSFAREGALGSISVRDTGVGFDEQFATRMFEPFAQAEQDRARPRRGLGLGLAIASRLAKLQGGTLSAESAGISQGANFTLRLLLAGKPAEGAAQ